MAAATVVNTKLDLPTQGRFSIAKYTWSTSYATGGELLTPSQFGVQSVTAIIPLGNNSDGRDVSMSTTANALQIFNAGSPAPIAQGRVTLVAGTATVVLPSALPAATKQFIHLNRALAGGTHGILVVGTRTVGTSFVINSSSGTDTSVVDWSVWPPGSPLTTSGVTGQADRAVLVAGTVTPAQTATGPATQQIFLTAAVTGGTPGNMTVGARTAGTGFVITSDNAADTSQVDWAILPPPGSSQEVPNATDLSSTFVNLLVLGTY